MKTTNTETTGVESERRAFQLHKNMLWPIIKSQAGTLGKAVLETIMNSLDASSTHVHIELTSKKLTIVDDGRGFRSRQEIEEWFETFGTPHKEGDSKLGVFRAGRGQIMSFSRNRWRSGNFQMSVDIRDRGLEYDLDTLDVPHPGCLIEAELYDPLSPSELIRASDEIRALCKYSPIPVFLGGERVSLDTAKEQWTFEDDDAYYMLKPHTSKLDAYNLGMFVRSFWTGDFGIGGFVVSKVRLACNLARNDILVSECKVWPRIAAKVRAHARSTEEKRPTQNDAYRELTLQRLITGGFDSPDEFIKALEVKLFTDYSGKHYTLERLTSELHTRGGAWAVPSDYSLKADRAHQMKIGLIFSPKMLERSRNMPMADMLKRLRENLMKFKATVDKQQFDVDYAFRRMERCLDDLLRAQRPIEELTTSIKDDHHPVEEKKLSKSERAVLTTLNNVNYLVAAACKHATRRALKVCESETVEAYTDGKSVIFINRKLLTIPAHYRGAYRAFDYLRTVLLHEYCHDSDDSTGHGHPPEFFEAFHDAIGDSPCRVGEFAFEAILTYATLRKREGLPLRAAELAALDMDDTGGGTDAPAAAGEQPDVNATSPSPAMAS